MQKILIVNLILLTTLNLKGQIFKEKYIKDATAVSNKWLNNISSNNYSAAYSEYSNQVKENSDSLYWLQAIDQLMKEFGTLEKREVINSEFKINIENLGDGFYVFIEYASSYEKIKKCSEYMLLGQNDKIEWKILRYDFSYESEELEPDKNSPN